MSRRIAWLHCVLPLASLLTLSVIVYGSFFGRLGFYWDDWPVVYAYQSFGTSGLKEYFANDRPFSAIIYSLLFPILGESATLWFFVGLALRVLCSAILFLCLAATWPRQRETVWVFSVLLLLYPGFSQQAIAITYVPQFVSLLLYSASLAVTVAAANAISMRRWMLIAIAVAMASIAYLGIEYFIGLELIRPLILYQALRNAPNSGDAAACRRSAMRLWAPFAVALIGWVAVHSYYSITQNYRGASSLISNMVTHPALALARDLAIGLRNLIVATVSAWARPLRKRLRI